MNFYRKKVQRERRVFFENFLIDLFSMVMQFVTGIPNLIVTGMMIQSKLLSQI